MRLRNSISAAKKLFRETLQTFKSLFSGGYRRLPKSPRCNPFSCGAHTSLSSSYRELDRFYRDYMDTHWDGEMKPDQPKKRTVSEYSGGSFMKFAKAGEKAISVSTSVANPEKGDFSGEELRGARASFLREKLRELETMMGSSNLDHVHDVEEILHYYSRLNCPAYLEILDKFFMEICAEFCGQQGKTTTCKGNSRLKLNER